VWIDSASEAERLISISVKEVSGKHNKQKEKNDRMGKNTKG